MENSVSVNETAVMNSIKNGTKKLRKECNLLELSVG